MYETLEIEKYYKYKGEDDLMTFNNTSTISSSLTETTWLGTNTVYHTITCMDNPSKIETKNKTINLAKDDNFSGTIETSVNPSIWKAICYPYIIKSIDVKVPNKVMIVKFVGGREIKVVCDKDDEFSVERGLYIAIAKYKFGKTHTTEGIEYEADKLKYLKEYVKYVKDGAKLYYKDLEEKQKKIEEEERIKKYKEKRKAYKARRKERKRNEKIDIIADAIKKANFAMDDDLK